MPPPPQHGLRAALVLILLALTSCARALGPDGERHRVVRVQEHTPRCVRATMGRDSPYRMPLAPPVDEPSASALLSILPSEARHAARAGGLEPLLVELIRERASLVDTPHSLRLIALRQELTHRLIALETQVSSLAFETSCTRQHVGDLLHALDRREGERQLSLATASLVVGAVTGTVAGVWDLRARHATDLPAIVGISGGVATAGLGAASLLTPTRAVWLSHEHNLLRPMVEGSDPDHLYPSFVFRMLTVQYAGDTTTTRTGLLAEFGELLGQFDTTDPALVSATLFGQGGVYERSLLELREHMLHLLESAVQGVARDLELLNRSLVRELASAHYSTPRHRHHNVTWRRSYLG